jgi:hypothetical protein
MGVRRCVKARSTVTQGYQAHKGSARSRAPPPRQLAAKPLAFPPRVKPEKTFRLEEANAIVPHLQILMERLQRGALRLHEEMSELARETGVEPSGVSPEDLLRQRPAARLLVEELDAIVHEIEASGAHLKDVQLGLVDFPAERDGEIIYLCWQFGESEVAFWHRIEDGFAGRQPLPGSAPLRYLQ